MKRLIVTFIAMQLAATALAQDKPETVLDRWNGALSAAAKAVGVTKDLGEVRKVPRGASPEILLQDDALLIDGKALKLGQRLEDWDKVLPGKRRCEGGKVIRACVWDAVGFRVTTQFANPKRISSVKVFLTLPDPEGYTVMLPAKPFGGYVELDGFGIDAQTKFWEVRQSARQDRNIRCGLRECVSPHGALGQNTSIYFGLSEHNEHGTVTAFELGRGDLD